MIPPTYTYLVHPDEREHMERYLAGTDDPMYDFIHHLQYLPAVHHQAMAAVARDFEENVGEKKKRKTTE